MYLSLVHLYVCLGLTLVIGQDILNLNEGNVCKQENGRRWTCKRLTDCSKALEDLEVEIIPELCSFDGIQPVICCEQTQPKSIQMCNQYARNVNKSVYSKSKEIFEDINTCAASKFLISTGVEADPREFPHMALIGHGDRDPNNIFCDGSLISERFVLSAAHCTEFGNVLASWMRLGDYDFRSTDDEANGSAKSVELGIIEIITHRDYKSPNLYHDIALFKLDGEVKFDEYIRPICLQTEHQIPEKYLIATGWSLSTNATTKRRNFLEKSNQTILSKEQCEDSYRSTGVNSIPQGIQYESMLCTQDHFNSSEPCKGDSGGPLQYLLSEPYCMYSLVGLTSLGSCHGNKTGIYTRVSNYVDWIENIVWP